jgi:hypothetical protein
MSTRRRLPGEPLRDCVITIPLTADQLAKIRAAAELEGDSVAAFVRSTLVCRARAVIGSVGAPGNGWSCSCVGPEVGEATPVAGDGSEAGA